MSIREKVFNALNVSSVTDLLQKDTDGRCIYHLHSPDAGSYPIIVYSIVSDVPALTADNAERERRVTARITILSKDGAIEPIRAAVLAALIGAGFMRLQETEIYNDGLYITAIDFRNGIGAWE